MYLVEIFLPLHDNQGRPFPRSKIDAVTDELFARFGGLTAFTRSPAKGLSLDRRRIVIDEVVVVEVMADALDEAWWAAFRSKLEDAFAQDEVLVRSTVIQKL